jgi:SAM-dependent MidA family methyltransferase
MDITLTDTEKAHSARLSAEIALEVASHGGYLPFARYMEMALYQAGSGYYSAGAHKLGIGGDFTTAPEISPFFGMALTNTILPVLEAFRSQGKPTRILEFGAGTGKLAASILHRLAELDFPLDHYGILEIAPDLAQRQLTLLQETKNDLQCSTAIDWLSALPSQFEGIIIANEVLDAIPCERIVYQNGEWHQQGVVVQNDALALEIGPVVDRQSLPDYLLTHSFAEGYTTEINPQSVAWITAVTQALTSGLFITLDYGFPASEFFHPQREQGTLMAHHRHHTITDPLYLPGLCDLTSHVEWSSISSAALAAGADEIYFNNQGNFLLEAGIGDLVLEKMDPANATAFLPVSNALQKLLSEAEMGELFKAFAFKKNLPRLSLDMLPGLGGRNRFHSL